MFGKNTLRKLVSSFTLVAVWCVYSSVAFAAPVAAAGELTVTGQVTVNGQAAVSNSTIVSGSSIVTGPDSTATVTLGKAGRVELLANSTLTLNFSDSSITTVLGEGKVRISNSAGVAASVATRNGSAIADSGQANNFAVEAECSHTHVETTSGIVTLREGASDKQVVAGTSATAGNLQQDGCKPCMRPGSAPRVAVAGLPWLLLVAAGIAGAAVFFGSRRNKTVLGGGVVVVSPVR